VGGGDRDEQGRRRDDDRRGAVHQHLAAALRQH
jgi:hypothetical protein